MPEGTDGSALRLPGAQTFRHPRRVLAAVLFGFVAPAASAQELSKLPDLVDRVAPSVVGVAAVGAKAETKQQPAKEQEGQKHQEGKTDGAKEGGESGSPSRSQGSGFVFSEDGYIITAGHILKDAREVTVTLDGATLPAKIVGTDERTDLGVLKVDSPKPLVAARLGNSDAVRRGEPVIVIGDPFGLGGSVSLGIISATKRNVSGPYDYFQTDAAINRGTAGGPLFNFAGEVVAMANAIYSPGGGNVGIGFALPSNLVAKVATEIKAAGSVSRGWFGTKIQDVDADTAASLGLPKAAGALISEILEGGPAAEADLKSGDVVLTVDAEEISDARHLQRIIGDHKAGATVQLTIWRDRQRKTVPVRLGRFPQVAAATPPASSAPQRAAVPGLEVATNDAGELAITKVDAGSDAEAKGLKKGHVIIDAGGMPTRTPGDLADAVAKNGERSAILLRIKKPDGDSMFIAIPLNSAQ